MYIQNTAVDGPLKAQDTKELKNERKTNLVLGSSPNGQGAEPSNILRTDSEFGLRKKQKAEETVLCLLAANCLSSTTKLPKKSCLTKVSVVLNFVSKWFI